MRRNWRHWRRGRRGVGRIAKPIGACRLRLQGWGQHRVDARLHWLLRLCESAETGGLRGHSLEAWLRLSWEAVGKGRLLLLLNTELRLRNEARGLRHQSVLRLA